MIEYKKIKIIYFLIDFFTYQRKVFLSQQFNLISSLVKSEAKLVAYERISILIHSALSEKHQNYDLANKQAQLAKKIAKRLRLKLPYNLRQFYCKKCKNFISPGYNSRVRIGRSNVKAIRITCLKCNYVYRKLF